MKPESKNDQNQPLSHLYLAFAKFFKVKKRMKIVDVDFNKSPFAVYWSYKFKLATFVVLEILLEAFITALPFLISWIIISQNYNLLIPVAVFFILIKPIDYFSVILSRRLSDEIVASAHLSAIKFFLNVDPQFYVSKSTGQIISKVNKASSNLSNLISQVGYSILALTVSIITSIVFIFSSSWQVGTITLISTGITFILFAFVSYKYRKTFTKKSIIDRDKFSATNIETLQQLSYIRSLFATPEQYQKIDKDMLQASESSFLNRAFGALLFNSSNTLIRFGFLAICWVFVSQIQSGQVAPELALACIYSYLGNSYSASRLGNQIQEIQTQIVEINDLWDFIRGFGTQSFPVLENSLEERLESGEKTIKVLR